MPVRVFLIHSLASVLEVALLVVFAQWGFSVAGGGWTGLLGAVLAVAAVSIVWGLWIMPKTPYRLAMPWLLVAKALIFALGGLAFWGVYAGFWAGIFVLVALVYLVLATGFGVL